MTRSEFLRLLAAAGAMGFGCSSGTKLKNWVWMDGHGDWPDVRWIETFKNMRRCRMEGALIQATPASLTRLIPIASDEGIGIQPWFPALISNDPEIMRSHSEWYTVSREGRSSLEHPPYVGYYKWLCPSRAEVRETIRSRVKELAVPGVSGVHLDYIRHCDVILPVGIQPKYNLVQDKEYPEFDFCYCAECRRQFQEETGEDPLKIERPDQHEEWIRFRYDSVTRLVNEIAKDLHGMGLQVTAAVFPSPDIARRLVRQDWPYWDLDGVFPMMYHEYYYKDIRWIGEATREGVKAMPGVPLYSGLYVDWFSPSTLTSTLKMVKRNGGSGIALFSGEAVRKEHWEALAAEI